MRLSPTAIILILSLVGCGGGGGSSQNSAENSSGASQPATSNSNQTAAILEPTWSLERKDPTELGTTDQEVTALLDHIFSDTATQSVLISKRGYIIGERYADGYDETDMGTSWSVAKSFYGALIGIAIQEKWIDSVDQKASEIITEWQNSDKSEITVGQILAMRSGYSLNDDIFFQTDQTQYAIDSPLARSPNAVWSYSNENSQLMEPLIRRATGLDAHSYLSEKLLDPMNIEKRGLWLDATAQNPLTYCCIDLLPQDFLKFGLLFARAGQWEDTQLVPAEFVEESIKPHRSFYGYQWWLLNDSFFANNSSTDTIPDDVFAAFGLNGQKIYVWPSADVVVVVLTIYEHFENQGYVLSSQNFPNTCAARNSCPSSVGEEVTTFDERALLSLMEKLDD